MKKHTRCVRLTAFTLAGLMAFCLTACGGEAENAHNFESVTEGNTEETEITLSPEEIASEIEKTTVPTPITEAVAEVEGETSVPVSEVPAASDTAVTETPAPADPAAGTALPGETTAPGDVPTSATVFGVSTYLGKSTDGTERYFLFNAPLGGSCIAQKDGASMTVTYVPQEEDTILFDMGGTVSKAEMSRIDADTIMLLWDNGVTETLTKMPNNPNEPFVFFSTDDLCQRALVYYEQKTGYRPSQVGAMLQVDGTVAIQLYDNLVDHNTTSDWYTIDRYTGIGTNVMGETIDLSQVVLE